MDFQNWRLRMAAGLDVARLEVHGLSDADLAGVAIALAVVLFDLEVGSHASVAITRNRCPRAVLARAVVLDVPSTTLVLAQHREFVLLSVIDRAVLGPGALAVIGLYIVPRLEVLRLRPIGILLVLGPR